MRDDAARWGYAACVFAISASVVWQEFPPCVDYPQHLALAKQLRDLLLGHGEGTWVPWTYNGLFHFAAAILGLALPLELAGRLVLASALALSALAVWRMLHFGKRPALYAFAWLPFAYTQAFAWGFVNFMLSVALATLATIAWFERRSAALFVALSWLTVLAHPLGIPIVSAGAALGVATGTQPSRALALLLPAVAWTFVAHAANDPSPHIGWANEIFWPEWSDRLAVGQNLLGPWYDNVDDGLALATAGVLLVGVSVAAVRALRRPRNLSNHPFGWLSGAALLIYALGPLSVFGCWYFYQRAGYCVLLWLPAMLPARSGDRWQRAMAAAVVVLGTAGTLNFVDHELRSVETADARAIIDAVPVGASVAPVMDIREGSSTWSALRGKPVTDKVFWGHFPAYLVVRRNAEVTWMFSREHGHFPVRHPSRGELGFPPGEHSWAREFHADADYARRYRHVLVRTTDVETDYNPAKRVFGKSAPRAISLAHHGRFWLFELAPEVRLTSIELRTKEESVQRARRAGSGRLSPPSPRPGRRRLPIHSMGTLHELPTRHSTSGAASLEPREPKPAGFCRALRRRTL